MNDPGMTYAGSGVNYDIMDHFKRMAQGAALATANNATRLGARDVAFSRGESVYLMEEDDRFSAHAEEGLGTKCLVADQLCEAGELTGLPVGTQFYGYLGQDTVAMIVNDMITLGALPLSVAMHLAVGSSSWFGDQLRLESLIDGWQHACDLARCVWGGGETPTLKDIIVPGAVVLSGSAMGIIKPKDRLIRGNVQAGDAIVMLGSSGIHANGLTLVRDILNRVGYDARLSDGRLAAEAVLDPTCIYVAIIEELLDAGVDIHYTANITGHGWRKLMRAKEPFVYVIEDIPTPQPIFDFIRDHGPVDEMEMYGNYNMGAGFALFVSQADVPWVIRTALSQGINAWYAGQVTKRGDEKKVLIVPKGLEYDKTTLEVR